MIRTREIVALFDLQDKGSGLEAGTLENLAGFLAARLAQGGYQVVPRDQIKERLRAAQKESKQATVSRLEELDGLTDIMIQHNFGHLQTMLGVGKCGS